MLVRLRKTKHGGELLACLAKYIGPRGHSAQCSQLGKTLTRQMAQATNHVIIPLCVSSQRVLRTAVVSCLVVVCGCKSDYDKLCSAVRSKDVAKLKRMLDSGVSPNHRPRIGINEPLDIAIGDGSTEIVKELLAHGADAKGFMNPPLCCAAASGHVEIAKLLIAAGAVINARDNSSRSPLGHAAATGKANMVRFLLDAGAAVNVRDDLGVTPLGGACLMGYADVVEMLLQRGADPNIQNMQGKTALHQAARNGDLAIVRHLLAAGADPKIKDLNGETPADTAELDGHKAAAEVLRVVPGNKKHH